jgi:hypothetical protein
LASAKGAAAKTGMNANESRQFQAWTEYIVCFLSRQLERTVLLVQEYRAWPLGD